MLTNRRKFLIGGASVTAAALPIVSTRAKPEVCSPAFKALRERFAASQGELTAAKSACAAARSAFEAAAPAVPAELLCEGENRDLYQIGEREIDTEGREVWPANIFKDGKEYAVMPRKILSVGTLQEEAALYSPRSKKGKRFRRLLPIAEKYEAAIAKARAESGIAAAIERRYFASTNFEAVVGEICKEPAKTRAEVAFKARCVSALKEIPGNDRAGAWQCALIVNGLQLCDEVVQTVEA